MKTLAYSLLIGFLALAPASSDAQRITPSEILFKTRAVSTKPAAIPGIESTVPIFQPRAATKPAGNLSRIFRARIAAGHTVEGILSALRQRADIEYAQPNHLFRTFDTDDPRRVDQFHLDLINWPELMDVLPAKQREVIVGIIDSGIDADHEDLAARVWVNAAELNGRAGIDDDGNGYVDDVRGWDFTDAPTLPGQGDFVDPDNDPSDESSHGTQVAGVIGAISGNGIGVAGVADCRLLAIRAGLNFDQGGTFLQEDDLAAAIVYAVDNGADILNLSWGSFDRAFVIEDAIRYAVEHGVVVVAAAGNEGAPPIAYPAAFDNVISVSASEASGNLAGFSSYGPLLDLVAPGVNIVSTRPGNAYGPRSGSSFAAPQVAGLAALLLSRQPDLSPDQIRGALVAATTDLGEPGWDFSFGAGQIDAAKLIPFIDGQAPTTARIQVPGGHSDATDTVSVSFATSGPASAFRLSWGYDAEPAVWTPIASGSPIGSHEVDWIVPDSPADTSIVLRLEVDTAESANPIEHRLRLHANPVIPQLTSLFYGPILDGDRVTWRVRWTTQHPTTGSLHLSNAVTGTRDTLRSHKRDRSHEIILPVGASAETFDFTLLLERPSGIRTETSPESIVVVPARLPGIGFSEIGSLPDGFLADRAADFNGNGQREITLMPYVEGEAFSAVKIYEFASEAFTELHTTAEAFLPWNIGDVTHDGRPDLLGSSVARIRLLTGSTLPTDTVLDQSGVWGGEIGDADGDGANEILARSLTENAVKLYRMPVGGAFVEFATLADFSPGAGEIGSRFVLADLDDDFQRDVLIGDGDGDLWSYEYISGTFQPGFLIEGEDDTDARIIGGGTDLDGDGKKEFAVARAFPDPADALNGWWDLEIYEVDGTQVRLEWVQRITGVASPGNGISTGDLDGDGRDDLAVALIPDLYVIRADTADTYRPIFHTEISLTYRPLISDLDDDGAPEVIFNAKGAVRVFERDLGIDAVPRPEILQAVPETRNSVRLAWMPSPGATDYRLYRSTAGGPENLAVEGSQLSYVDAVSPGDTLSYRVEAIVNGSAVSSTPVTIISGTGPTVSRIDRIDTDRVGVILNVPVSDTATDPDGYRLFPQNVSPTSAIRDQGSRRILLTFPEQLVDGVTHTLDISTVTDLLGRPIDSGSRSVTFTPGLQSPAARADFDGDGIVGFSDFLQFAAAFGGSDPAFDFDTDGVVGFSDFLQFASVFGQAV